MIKEKKLSQLKTLIGEEPKLQKHSYKMLKTPLEPKVILDVKNWSLLQFSISWNDYPSWPYLQITFGSNGVFSILFWVYKFGLDVDILSRTWKWYYEQETELD